MDKAGIRDSIGRRVAQEFSDGDVVNLGIGIPTLAANHIPEGVSVVLQSENGMLGLGPKPEEGRQNRCITNAGGGPVTVTSGGVFFDSCESFEMIRGGHVDITVLGALQVDEKGNLANWIIPGKKVPGMGGAMDLVFGARRVIVAMEHTVNGVPKLLKSCTYPLTAAGKVDMIITEMCVLKVREHGFVLVELLGDHTLEEVRRCTDAPVHVDEKQLRLERLGKPA